MKEEVLREILEEFVAELTLLIAQLKEEEVEPPVVIVLPEFPEEKGKISERTMIELVSHEGIVKEAYKDSKGIWTWGVGVTDASGHTVERYKDNPQTLERVMEIFEWLVRTRYLPDVEAAFDKPLTEAQKAAALSFHYNTGAIKRAAWVKAFNEGDIAKARLAFMNWRSPEEIIPRRKKERDLFFDGKWSCDGKVTVYERVNKPSYTPDWSSAKRIDIKEELS